MKKTCWCLSTVLVIFVLLCVGGCKEEKKQEMLNAVSTPVVAEVEDMGQPATPVAESKDGQALFQQHCAVCHPGGGNIINPDKGLDGETLAANGVVTAGDIVALMREPRPGMSAFSKDLLSDRDAGRIAEYILQTY
jgi:cytochrome c6